MAFFICGMIRYSTLFIRLGLDSWVTRIEMLQQSNVYPIYAGTFRHGCSSLPYRPFNSNVRHSVV
jgi:hypothetical protein